MKTLVTFAALAAPGAALAHPGDHHATLSGALSHPVLGGLDPLVIALALGGLGLVFALARK